jgi:hypothetical protein
LVETTEAQLQKLKQSKEDLEYYLKTTNKEEIKEGLAILKKVS